MRRDANIRSFSVFALGKEFEEVRAFNDHAMVLMCHDEFKR
ncbi:MAG: hypothetical protein OEM02_11835 [Desulfobulbaceae bacterium]|nr:hypothetical protein [Desulfobulbaceae bacterium]